MTSKPDPPDIVDRREEKNQFDIDESEVSEAEEESKDDNNDNRKEAKKEIIILVQEEPDNQFSDAIGSPEMQPTRQSVDPPENNVSPTTATQSIERNAAQTVSRERQREEDRSNNDTSAIPVRPGAQHIMGLGRSGWGSGVVDADGDSHMDSDRISPAINAPAGETTTSTTQEVPLIPEAVIAPDVGLIVQDAVQEALRQRDQEEAVRRQSRRVVENEERAEIVQGVIVQNEKEEEGAVWNWKLVTFLIFIVTFVTVIALAVTLSSGKEENETQAPTQSPTKTPPPTTMVTERNESTFAVEAYMCEIPYIYFDYPYEDADIPLDKNSTEYPPGVYFEEMEPETQITSHEPFIQVCMRPNQKARDEGMTMRSIESFVFSRIHPNDVAQPAIVNGSPASNDLTIPGPCFEVEGASQCFFESQLSSKLFDETAGRIMGLGSGTMQLISAMSNVTVISNFEMSFNVAGYDEPTSGSGAFLDNTVPGSMLLLGLIIGVASLILFP